MRMLRAIIVYILEARKQSCLSNIIGWILFILFLPLILRVLGYIIIEAAKNLINAI